LYYSVGYHAIDELLFKELNHARTEVDKVIDAGEINGVLLGLVRNSELEGLKKTIVQLEEKFNHQKYPYVFLNDEEFSLEFKEEIRKIVDVVEFGTIPRQHWSLPSWISNSKFRKSLKEMNGRVSYGGLESYRHMCRFNSGFFYKHHLLDKYDYYWRIEPDVDFYCQLRYDPFKVMKAAKKKYGYAVLAYEEMETVNGLWEATVDFMKEYDIKPKHLFKMFKENGKDEYNGIHFW
jgi:alpha 1,2-mannosyltransferase